MNSAQLRQSFLDFFRSKGHAIVPSASLMPTSPNLLFTNAGMNPFVPYFLGEAQAPNSRIADTQKCIRAGGKHNDLEDVGFDTYHHTLFEMLGNWSFGDYFKKESLEWGWELLTKEWKFPKERLYATVYQPSEGDPSEFDHESYAIWKGIFEREGLDPKKHICYGTKKDNFWMMGDTGPCGPCSEIHVDLTPKGDSNGTLVNQDSPYCIEIWNHVFIQFNAEASGNFVPLSQKHVDTGMGFERVAGIIANTRNFTDFSRAPSNYESDLFQDIFKHISKESGKQYHSTIPQDRNRLTETEMNDCIFRVLGDHIRTLSFSIADGILPGNEGRNYVLRRILRRAVMFGRRLNLPAGFFSSLAVPLIEKMGPVFPELSMQKDIIVRVLSTEEKAFEKTLDRGLQLLEKVAETKCKISGEDAFQLYDTYGFPIDLTALIAKERGLELDMAGFEVEMDKQRARARAAHQKTAITVNQEGPASYVTEFVGYALLNCKDFSTQIVHVMEHAGRQCVMLAQTPFYAEMGGQLGDMGTLTIDDTVFRVLDTIKDKSGNYMHMVESSSLLVESVGKVAIANVDLERRLAIQRNHTATHLLHWALRKVLGTHVKQAGSLVSPDYLRFDFAHFEAISPEDLQTIERLVNECVLENASVRWYEVPFSQKPEECLAFFGEKYGNTVRVVDIGGYSMELCGGTHVLSAGEIGLVKVTTEAAIAAGTRRLEAVTGMAALRRTQVAQTQLESAASLLSCQSSELVDRLETLLAQKTQLEKAVRSYQQKDAAGQMQTLANKAFERNELRWLVTPVVVSNPDDMRGLGVRFAKEQNIDIVVLGGDCQGKVTVMAFCSPSAIEKGYKAGTFVQDVCTQLGGKGGGKNDFAMGGAKDVAALERVFEGLTSTL